MTWGLRDSLGRGGTRRLKRRRDKIARIVEMEQSISRAICCTVKPRLRSERMRGLCNRTPRRPHLGCASWTQGGKPFCKRILRAVETEKPTSLAICSKVKPCLRSERTRCVCGEMTVAIWDGRVLTREGRPCCKRTLRIGQME